MSSEAEKIKRIHMDARLCAEFSNSSEGVKPLTAPDTVKKTNKDPNRGLYPKIDNGASSSSSSSDGCYPSFSKASEYYVKRKRCQSPPHVNTNDEMASVISSSSDSKICVEFSQNDNDSDLFRIRIEPALKRKKKEIPPQNNKITGYLLKAESSACVSSVDCRETTTSERRPDLFVGECSNLIGSVNSESFLGSTESVQLPVESDWGIESKKQQVSNCFGLFGAMETDENPEPDYFNQLPLEVMEHIFCQLPFLDLQNCRGVCHLWNDVISSESFIHWKTTYYKLKYGCSQTSESVAALLSSLEGNTANHCLHALVRFMKTGFTRVPAPEMLQKLKNHKKFDAAESVLKERFPDWKDNISPWCFITIIILLSESVSDVSEIIHLLSYTVDVLEALYCNATFLLYCMNALKINHGLHYRVYYALYTYENHLPAEIGNSTVQSIQTSGQQSMHNYCSSLRLTCEQNRIVRHCLKSGDVIKVIAFAGSGKTSTLIELARRNPNFRFLNVMFNKSVCDHAQKLFPSNVKCQTAHSLAFASKGKQFMRRLAAKFSLDIIMQHINISDLPFETLPYCRAVVITIQNFMASDDTEIFVRHVPEAKPITNERMLCFPALSLDQKFHVRESSVAVWKILTDGNEKCPVTHDVYLKMYQISKPVINQYHCIMVDEAQDCNPAMLDIVLSQNVPVILVGDPHQQIYGFRGSKNALQDIKSTHTYHLTKSFRFGPEIAYVASCCIEVLKNYRRETLVGCTKHGTVSGVIRGQYAVIARSNLGLFNEAIRLCCQRLYKHEDEPRSIHAAFIGGLRSYGVDLIEDIYRLKALAGRKSNEIKPEDRPRDKFLRHFSTFRALVTYAERKDDTELSFKIELVLQHGDRIPDYMAILRRKCSTELELANVVFTTAHKSKGFEFDTVRLVDDYNIGRNPIDIAAQESEEECNVMYVALTRAKSSLFITEKLYNVLLLAQEKFEYPIPSKSIVVQDEVIQNCVLCFTPLKPHTVLSLVRRRVTLTTGRTLKQGPMCIKCATAPYYRPQVVRDPVIMYLDPIEDFAHRSLKFLVGPLPSDPPVSDDYDAFRELHAMDLIYVINVGIPH